MQLDIGEFHYNNKKNIYIAEVSVKIPSKLQSHNIYPALIIILIIHF